MVPTRSGECVACGGMTERASGRQRRAEARRFRELARHTSDIVLIVDADARVQYLSPSAERLMGYKEDEWLGREAWQVFHPDDLELAFSAFGTALATPGVNEPLEVRVRRNADEWRWFEVVATNLVDHPDIRGVVLRARDITDLKAAQEELATTAHRFEALLANLSDMVTVVDAQGTMSYVSPAAERLVGRRADERVGASIFDYVHPDDAPTAIRILERALGHPGPIAPFEVRLRHEDGRYRVFEVRANNLLADPGVRGVIVNSRDVTDRVAAERALAESEQLHRTIVESATEGIWIVDDRAVTTFVNPRMAELLGYTTVEMLGRPSFDFVDEAGREVALRNLERRRAGVTEQHEFCFLRKDGTAFWAAVSSTPFLERDGTFRGAIALVTDITDRRRAEAIEREAALEQQRLVAEVERHRLEAELARARRLESLGRLAGGVAHDFNNLLGVILNYASVAAEQLSDSHPAADDIARIQQAAEQAADVTRKLLVFGRSDPLHIETVDLNALVGDVVSLVERAFGDGITLTTDLTAESCLVRADHGQLEKVLMNLLVNARDASSVGSVITVTTSCRGGAACSPEDREVALSVADQGAGMPADVLDRAFEPFFTTKSAEGGSGLGLATVHSIVERSGGRIAIESEVGNGTTVRVVLPAAPAPASG